MGDGESKSNSFLQTLTSDLTFILTTAPTCANNKTKRNEPKSHTHTHHKIENL